MKRVSKQANEEEQFQALSYKSLKQVKLNFSAYEWEVASSVPVQTSLQQ
jgi:hypothetical protein